VKVKYRKKFLKELSQIPSAQRVKVEGFVFKVLPQAESIHQLGVIEQMKGYPFCFKVRFGSYRLGLKIEGDSVILEKALHRKDIYRHFP
jgi:mRNA interferase RelE/StbE